MTKGESGNDGLSLGNDGLGGRRGRAVCPPVAPGPNCTVFHLPCSPVATIYLHGEDVYSFFTTAP
ncbi:MAG: hypothetical protein DYH02_07920 [Candidatus Omnitrophica bacterium COP1]|nr:hypothetical protein [Candidatus Omnitrophica bacterium COP1]